MKQIVVLLILSLMSFWLISDEIPFRINPENFSDAKSNSDKSQHSFLCGFCVSKHRSAKTDWGRFQRSDAADRAGF